MSFRQRLFTWFQKSAGRKYEHVRFADSMSDVPDDPGASIFVVGHPSSPKWVVFQCPCNSEHRLQVPLMKSAHPRWTLDIRGEEASLRPSIWVNGDPCDSHFWLYRNRIQWAHRHRK
jgi:hypothetical protein